ncbi:EAL and HDOD domain-containing protein [Cellulomonas chengniuliangii]|uniref:HDOD domain-containing protein n=1 Tax=Cellulomonas chengniuliangii TaxID=2968084 RepID=A0ABY5KZH9_9CELL|nr:HDOD domain-containing protein [Cellulomonas chengniuliangii]MCC2307282.1 HDOD domain-containing protein [Cellulomonas chengniuliangii]MCC2317822.1 HDOD domain-containing protein [Cellulomonas chengniuliangii]UUI75927.1 HDOD domain-containing protein [Cellulomonas chengniuliangii]
MSVLDGRNPAARVSEITVLRQPVVHSDRAVYGYAIRVVVLDANGTAFPEHQVEHLIEAEYDKLDLAALAGDRAVLLRATNRLLTGELEVPTSPHGVVLELSPLLAQRADARLLVDAARQRGARIALADYTGSSSQDELLPQVDLVKVDVARGPDRVSELASRAHAAGATVIGERADNRERIRIGQQAGIDLLQGPMFQRHPETTGRDFSAGELQCLELMQLLSGESIDQAAVVRVVSSDPELAIRVLHLVNSSVYALRREIDSVHQAVVLVGPQQLAALAMASLIDARPTTVGALWATLTRALTCRALAGDDAAYTVGLLSAVASQLGIATSDLVSRTGVSADVAHALNEQTGPYGPTLAAVLAHEENDVDGVRATGLEPYDVAHAYLAAVPEALATATSLAVGSRS